MEPGASAAGASLFASADYELYVWGCCAIHGSIAGVALEIGAV